jgi:hypothetical protein
LSSGPSSSAPGPNFTTARREDHRIQLGLSPYVVGDDGGLVVGELF